MRVRSIVAVLVAGALAGATAPAAGAAPRLTQVQLRTSGSVRVVWHGDRARGCAAAGLCGYRGSIVYPARRGSGFVERIDGGPPPFSDLFGFLETPGRTVARTERAVAGGDPAVCSQRSRSKPFTLSSARSWRGRQWLTLGADISPPLLASGQCAGPRLEDFSGRLPSALIRRRALDRRGARVSLAGRFPFTSGPLRGQVISTLRLRSRGVRSVREIHEVDEGRRDGKHQLYVELRYRVISVEGEFRNDFRAVTAPVCKLRDACGTRGSELYSINGGDRKMEVRGFLRTRSRKRPPLRRALRRILRHGFLNGDVPIDRSSGLTTHAFVRPGAATCTDHFRPRRPPFVVLTGGEGRLGLGAFGGDASILRGRCPGPVDPGAFGGALAASRVPRGRFLKRTFELRLRSRRDFRTGAYRGARTVRLDVRLRRTRARVTVDPDFGEEGSVFLTGLSPRARAARQRP